MEFTFCSAGPRFLLIGGPTDLLRRFLEAYSNYLDLVGEDDVDRFVSVVLLFTLALLPAAFLSVVKLLGWV